MAETSRESDKFMLRLPDGMRERIKAAAELSNRSMNAEIVATLEKAYPALTGIDAAIEQVKRLLEVARVIGAEHVVTDLSLDLRRTLSEESQQALVLMKALNALPKE